MTADVRGHHWLIDCSDCRCDEGVLRSREVVEARCVQACRDAGMRIVGSAFHQFEPGGVTGVVLLAESHLSVHTWPIERFAAIDVYVCNHGRDNLVKGHALVRSMSALFAPGRCANREVVRESVDGGGTRHASRDAR